MHEATDDRRLIERLAAGDQTALRALLARHQLRVLRFLVRLVRNDSISEELTNEVFLEAWKDARTFEGRSSASTWLLSIAHNRAVSALRNRGEESWNEEVAAEIADSDDDPEVAQKAEKSAVMRRCMLRRSQEHREIIDLVYYHEMSITEVASVTRIPEATVKTRMFYGRKRLAELLKAEGIDRGWP
jgi:RNA polymerase sigma-70 factor (ECF subfamily)